MCVPLQAVWSVVLPGHSWSARGWIWNARSEDPGYFPEGLERNKEKHTSFSKYMFSRTGHVTHKNEHVKQNRQTKVDTQDKEKLTAFC